MKQPSAQPSHTQRSGCEPAQNSASDGTRIIATYHAMRIAMTAQVYVVLAEARQVLAIPSSALGDALPDGRYTVRVTNAKGLPEARTITVGINNNVMAEVTAGLAAGEQVVMGEAGAGSGQMPGGAVMIGP